MSGAWLWAEAEAAPLGSEPLDLSDLAHLVVEARDLVVLVAAAFKPRLAHPVVVVLPLALAEELALEARLPALARLVVVAGQLLQFLRSPSFSPTTARISPPRIQPTYELAPSTR
jgi:hypothetical protein